MQTVYQPRVVHKSGFVDLSVVLIGKYDTVVLNIYAAYVVFLGHCHKRTVIDFFYLPLCHPRDGNKIKQQDYKQHDTVVKYQRLFRFLYFVHQLSS